MSKNEESIITDHQPDVVVEEDATPLPHGVLEMIDSHPFMMKNALSQASVNLGLICGFLRNRAISHQAKELLQRIEGELEPAIFSALKRTDGSPVPAPGSSSSAPPS